MSRSRSEATHTTLGYLLEHGDITDDRGRAAVRLAEALGYQTPRGMNLVLEWMEHQGYIVRVKATSRTYAVKITPSGRMHYDPTRKVKVKAVPPKPAPKLRVKGDAKPAENSKPRFVFPENVPWEKLPVDHDQVCRSQAQSQKFMDLAS